MPDRPGRADAAVPLLLLVLAGAILFAKLGHVHLANFDDCYYAEKAKEMVRGGDWLTPHFAGIPRADNPPLFLWLMAAAFAAFGVHEWTAIFWSALSGVLCIPLLYGIARRELRLDPFEAWSAAVILLGTQYFFKYSRHAMFDVFLTLLFLAGIAGYVRAAQGARKGLLLLGLATGLGVMTKSVLGLFPLLVAVVHMLWTGRRRLLLSRWFLSALALAALVAVPWYAAQILLRGDRFVEEHFRWLLVERGLGVGAADRAWWSAFDYLREIATVYWPWLPLAVAGAAISLRRAFGRQGIDEDSRTEAAPPARGAAPEWAPRDTARLLLVWFFVVVGTMSLGAEKKLWYVMTVFPCLAVLSGIAAGAWIRDASRRRAVTIAGFTVLGLAAVAVHVLPISLSKARQPDLHRIALAARDLVPAGQKVTNLDAPYWSTVNMFLFYSDHDLTEPVRDPERVRASLRSGSFALVTEEGYDRVAGGDSVGYRVAAASGAWRLVRAAADPAARETTPAK